VRFPTCVEFRTAGRIQQPDLRDESGGASRKGKRRRVVSSVDLSPPRFGGQQAVRRADPDVMKLGSCALVYALNGVHHRLVCFVQAFCRGCDAQRYLNCESNPLGLVTGIAGQPPQSASNDPAPRYLPPQTLRSRLDRGGAGRGPLLLEPEEEPAQDASAALAQRRRVVGVYVPLLRVGVANASPLTGFDIRAQTPQPASNPLLTAVDRL